MDLNEIISKTPSIMLITYVSVVMGGLYFFLISIPKAIRTKSFSTIEGKITRSEVGNQALNIAHSPGDRVKTYTLDIEFKYVVEGKAYTSKKRKWHEAQTSFARYHDARARRYPQGKKVIVYYDPKRPQISVLEPGLGFGTFLGIIIALSSISLMTIFIFHRVYM